MAYVNIEIDLDELYTDDLVNELQRRLKSKHRTVSDEDKKRLLEAITLQPSEFGIEVKSLDDKMKISHFASVMNKYTCVEIEQRIP